MPTDPPDRPSPPRPWETPAPAEGPAEGALSRPKPRPLTGLADDETIGRVERVARPRPIARVGGGPEADRRQAPAPWEAEADGPPARRTPTWAQSPYGPGPAPAPANRAPGVIPREETDEVRIPEARGAADPYARLPPDPYKRAPDPAADARSFLRPGGVRLGETRPGDAPRGGPRWAEPPRPDPRAAAPRGAGARVDLAAPPRTSGAKAPALELPNQPRWQPREPRTWEEAGIDPLLGEQLALRYFALAGAESARQVANDLCLALPLVKELLEQLKAQKFLQHRGSTAMGDFIYELTDAGRQKAIDYKRLCAYNGPAPVPFAQYLASVREQTLRTRSPTVDDLNRAFADLLISEDLVKRLGPAITSGRAMFLHGDPGNGKTSIAERITRCFGDEIWIPHALLIDGHLVKLYDPATHVAVDPNFKPLTPSERLDRRWVKIQRPTVVAGGELTLDMLEIQLDLGTNVGEAPLQLKANCGTLVIDDFGRQRIEPQLLLNRWIFPLERRVDFLRLPDGRKITSPFDPLLIFSTNLEPKDLVDEAFLRRIPYKIQVQDPTEDEFRALFDMVASRLDVVLAEGAVDHLVEVHYEGAGRTFRFCHPRDLLLQVVNKAAFERRPRIARAVDLDDAVTNYFGAL